MDVVTDEQMQTVRRLEMLNDRVEPLYQAVVDELVMAVSNHRSMSSPHDGWAKIYEEMDELWEEVRRREPDRVRMTAEAIQVAATAMRFVLDVCAGL